MALVLTIVALIAFWFGRATAPDRTLAYEEGKREGARIERRYYLQSLTEVDALRAKKAAAISDAPPAKDPSAAAGKSTEEAAAGETAAAHGADN